MATGPEIHIITLFPELLEPFIKGSVLGAALRDGRAHVRVTDLRAYAHRRREEILPRHNPPD